MDRRHFLELMGAGSAVLGLPHLRAVAQPRPDGPNVLLLILEDLNDWVGCMGGHPDTITPNLDAFAASGVLFTNAHCASPACNPSRAAFLTGLHPVTTGVNDNQDDWRDMVPPGHPTLPGLFHDQGYYTMRVGKVHHPGYQIDGEWDEEHPEIKPHNLVGHTPYLPYHPANGQRASVGHQNDFFWGPTDNPLEEMTDYKRLQRTYARIQSGLPGPWFAAVGLHKVHFPMIAPRRYFEAFNPDAITLPPMNPNDLDDLPPVALDFIREWWYYRTEHHKNYRDAVHAYLATIHYLDDIFGRFMNDFMALPEAEDTAVIVMSDHGHHLGEKLHMRKFTLWEESTRSFMAWRVPGVTSPGGVCGEAVSLMDLYATLIEVNGLEPPETELDSLSLMPQLVDPSTPREQPALTTWEEGNHAVRDERWRYIRYHDGGEELYDHDVDPNEWTNLANDPDYAAIKAELAQWMPPL